MREEQVWESILSLPIQEQFILLNRLKIALAPEILNREQALKGALAETDPLYRHISQGEIEKDIKTASQVRKQRRLAGYG